MEWIDVKDELPNHGEAVLVFTDDFEFASMRDDGQWYLWGGEYEVDSWLPEESVSHWMKLVEPTIQPLTK